MIAVVVVVLSAALVYASPVSDQEEEYGGSKTLHAIKQFFRPVTSYFSSIPSKTPSDIVGDVKEKMDDVRDWAGENEAIQTLRGAISPVKTWIKEKADVVKDQTFSDLYENVKSSVKDMDDKIGTWLQEKTSG